MTQEDAFIFIFFVSPSFSSPGIMASVLRVYLYREVVALLLMTFPVEETESNTFLIYLKSLNIMEGWSKIGVSAAFH